MPSTIDPIAIANLGLSATTALCALYLAFATLKHTARPNIGCRLRGPHRVPCSSEALFTLDFENVGYWYAKPIAVNVIAYCNFDPHFKLREIRYGSVGELSSTEVRAGVGGMNYLKAKGLVLTYGEAPESVGILAVTPAVEGQYAVLITARSENGASFSRGFNVWCAPGVPMETRNSHEAVAPSATTGSRSH